MMHPSWHLLVGAGEGCVAGAEGEGGFKLQVVTSIKLLVHPSWLLGPAGDDLPA